MFWRTFGIDWNQAAVALMGLLAILFLSDGETAGLGFRTAPVPSWRFWCRLALGLGAGVGLIVAIGCGAVLGARGTIAIPRIAPEDLMQRFLLMCLYAPVVEELVYRSLLTHAVHPTVGDRGTIVVSGLVFAAIHVAYGNVSPENQVGGFVLAWAYLRSGTLLVPIALHAAGNAVAFLSQVASWYLLPPTLSW